MLFPLADSEPSEHVRQRESEHPLDALEQLAWDASRHETRGPARVRTSKRTPGAF